ncbi:MAG: hypothetical protein V4701_02130 [Pseudomonadota bacterium]
MADGAVTYNVTVDAATAKRLDAAAREAGVAPEAFVVDLIEDAADGPGMSEAARRFQHEQSLIALADYDNTGKSVDAKTALDAFVAEVEARAALRG